MIDSLLRLLAYIDPGAGSMLVQVIIGGVLATLFAIKMWWHNLISLFKRSKDRHSSEDSAENRKK